MDPQESGFTYGELTRLDALLDPLRVGVTVRCLADDTILLWNRGSEEIYGWTQSEAIGKPMHVLLQTRFPRTRNEVDEALRRDGRWEGDLVQIRRDGEPVVVASQQAVRYDGPGGAPSILAVDFDITRHKHVEADLRSSEEPFRLLISGIKDYAIYLLSPEGNVMSWNEGAQRLKGYRAEEILGQPYSRFYTPEDIDQRLPAKLLDRAATEGRVAAEAWRVRKDGSRFWADIVLTALRDSHGGLWGFAKVTRDLTERKEAEEARARANREEGARLAAEAAQADLRSSRDQLAAILAGVGEGITVQDRSGRLVYANDAAATLSGFPDAASMLAAEPREILDRFMILDESSKPFPTDRLPGRLLFQGQPATETLLQFRLADGGTTRWSVVNATPIRDEAGQVQLVVNIFHDVTDRRRAEETAHFLAAASVELTGSLDDNLTLQKIAQLAVPSLADWCLIDILDEGGRLRRLAAVKADPSKARLADDVEKRFPTNPASPTGVPRVIRTGQPELVPEISEALLTAAIDDPDLLAIVHSLQLRSVIIVPLIARGHTFGAITLIQAESGRRYGPEDLDAAQRLALHAALAIDNARLYRDAQQQADAQV
ncbi:MAG TPA: PAS domain S-box protein, partial [Chloroflexota bacterium]|nr:PAS domain S-box protein [Chloroflexota bacterium]